MGVDNDKDVGIGGAGYLEFGVSERDKELGVVVDTKHEHRRYSAGS